MRQTQNSILRLSILGKTLRSRLFAVALVRSVFLVALSLSAFAASTASPGALLVYEGTVAIQIADDFEHGRASTHYFLREQQSKELLELTLTSEQAKRIRPGQQLRVLGRREGKVLAADIDQSAVVVITEPVVTAVPPTARRAITLIVDITDGSGVLHAVSGTCDGPDQLLADHLFGSQTGRLNVDGCFQDGSYGGLGFGGSSYPGTAMDVVRVTIAEPALSLASVCSYGNWASAADAAAAAQGVNLGVYQHRVYVLPQGVGCSWAGLAYLGCGDTCQAWVRAYDYQVCGYPDSIAHELGHNVGLRHSRTDSNNDGVSDCEYCDESDVMGYANSYWRSFNAPHRDWMGWLPASRFVDGSAGGTYTISALGMANPPYPQVVKVVPTAGSPYWLSYRAAIGYDAGLPEWYGYFNKLQVHRADGSISYLITQLADGGTYVDESLGLTVRQFGHSADSATVQVWVGQQPPASAVTLTPSPASPGTIGATVTFSAAASGGSGSYQYKFLLRLPDGTLNTVRDYSATATWTWNTTGLAAGTYQVVVHARSVGSTKSYETYQSLSYGLATPASAVTLTPSVASPATIGASVTFNAAASGGSGNYQYKFLLRAPGGALNIVRDYSTTANWSWNTSGLAVGTYQVVVYARNVGSTKSYETYRSLSYGLATPASAVTLTPNVASPAKIGTMVTFNSVASGGSGSYQYMFLLRAPGGALNLVRDYSATASWSWNTAGLVAAGTYQVVVYARNVGSTKSYETYKSLSYSLTAQ
jgi:hypothetical protein